MCGLCDYIVGKIAWTIDGGSEVLGGLLVSDNGQVAVCDTPTAPVQTYTAQPAKESKIHVFDLKVGHCNNQSTCKTTNVNPVRRDDWLLTLFNVNPNTDK